jgi:hypothetical protein
MNVLNRKRRIGAWNMVGGNHMNNTAFMKRLYMYY